MAHTHIEAQHQNQQTQLDQDTKNRMGSIWSAGQAAANDGPGPLLNGAANYNGQQMNAGRQGTAALAGNPDAVKQMMNPYQQQVIDANNADWQHTNAQTMNAVDDHATQADAFGGSRAAVSQGAALANNNRAQGAQTADLLAGGYGQAMNQAGQLAQMGQQANAQNTQLGFAGVGNPGLWQTNMLKNGFMGPTGQSSSGNDYKGEMNFKLF